MLKKDQIPYKNCYQLFHFKNASTRQDEQIDGKDEFGETLLEQQKCII